jgi:hypothetical protein
MRKRGRRDDQLGVADRIDDSIPSDADPIQIAFPGQLFAAERPGIARQRPNTRHDPLPVFPLSDRLDLLRRGRFDKRAKWGQIYFSELG